jgi:hypothetical protein
MKILNRSDLVKNPYLRSKFIDFFFSLTDPHLEHHFDLYSILEEQMAVNLMNFYIGTHLHIL